MDKFSKHIFVCVNERPADHPKGCCLANNGLEVFQTFRAIISGRELKGKVSATKSGCLGECATGAIVVIYPEGVWYSRVAPEDVLEIIDKHILHNQIVTRLLLFPEKY